jgi:hypothetical protein
MKKFFVTTLVAILVLVNAGYAQFAAGFTNTGNVLTFKLKPSVTTTTGFSVIEFFVRYPTSSPAFTYGAVTVNTTNFPSMTATGVAGSGSWEIEHNNPAYAIAGYNVDHIFYTAPAPSTTVKQYDAGVEYDVISVPLNGAAATVDMEFVHQDFESNFYLALTSETGSDLRPLAYADYFFPLTVSTPGPDGSTIYYSALQAVVPVRFLGFNVTKSNNSALLNWTVENEDANTARYEIEYSTTGTEFARLATVAAANNGRSSNTYNFTQENLSAVRTSGVIYYRIKQIDADGRFTYTTIKSIRLDNKSFGVAAYPNPAKSYTKLTIELTEASPIVVTVSDASGKQVSAVQIAGVKGTNFRDINLANLASGSYILKVQAGNEVKSLPIVKTN